MHLDPLLGAPWHIQLHVFSTVSALVLGLIQWIAPKGTFPHKIVGSIWLALMWTAVLTAIFIVHPREPDEPFTAHFSFIHYFFIPLTVVFLIWGMTRLMRGGPNMKKHGSTFIGLFIGALVITGAFTLMPGRIMHAVVTGTETNNTDFFDEPYFYFLPGAEPPADDE